MKFKDQILLEKAYKTVLESSNISMVRRTSISREEAVKKYKAFLIKPEDALTLYNLFKKNGFEKKGAKVAEREGFPHLVYALIPKELIPPYGTNLFVHDFLNGTNVKQMTFSNLFPTQPKVPDYNLIELIDAYKEMTDKLPELKGIFDI